MRRSDTGFTLLEVMAAVAVVAIVFTTLSRVASQGLQSEGISSRRLEASLLADEVLSDIEAQVAAGATPAIGSEESEEGVFAVLIDVTAFDLASAIPVDTEAEGGEPGFTLSSAGAGATPESPVREIEITVRWTEGVNEFQVFRTTYGFDLASVQHLLGGGGEPFEPLAGAGGQIR
jgi:prepilin-type N-terminal cleavage/methylation domain-containing protein